MVERTQKVCFVTGESVFAFIGEQANEADC